MEVIIQDFIISKEPFFYASAKIKNFEIYKFELLDILNNSPHEEICSQGDIIHKLDFNIPNQRPYANIFNTLVNPYHSILTEKLSYSSLKFKICIDSLWFQQYSKSGIHNWHVHSRTNFSNILYVEKPEHLHTEFYCPITQHTIILDNIEEGSILTFPGYMLHTSPENKCNQTKTVIVFNSSIE